ncbi:hypothetical protein FRB96_002707 [Tulasnella sp. 330]|nr:hypothetical protein FRB96_002707 [Tulasnella sp. 330]KAG8884375.1 hypothetical protein FRB97_004384 [Tulasnella sp. 331]KAG8888044.1 hypothetical protein FRB98_008508 [Tulasnella sp. 332]
MPSAKVTLNGATLADSKDTIVIEGNHYFPRNVIDMSFFTPSDTHTTCHWKGIASYYNVEVNGKVVPDAAWYYPECKEEAKNIENYIAFYKNKVTIDD